MTRKIRCCKCGCGKPIRIKYHHKYSGIPEYVLGHTLKCKIVLERWNEIKNIIKYCKCGCGQEITIKSYHKYEGTSDYIQGHNSVGNYPSEDTKLKISNTLKGHPGANYKHTEESKKKMSISQKDKIVSSETKKKLSEINTGKLRSKESKKKQSKTLKEGYASGRIKKSKGRLNKKTSKETKKKQSMKAIERMVKREGKYQPKIGKLEIIFENTIFKKINNLKYEAQKYIKEVGFVDFFLTDYNIIIECDEKHHKGREQKQKDADRDFKAILYYNYRTIRFCEKDIREFPNKCIKILELETL